MGGHATARKLVQNNLPKTAKFDFSQLQAVPTPTPNKLEDEDMVNREESFMTQENKSVKNGGDTFDISKVNNETFCNESPDVSKVKMMHNYFTKTKVRRSQVTLQPEGDKEEDMVLG